MSLDPKGATPGQSIHSRTFAFICGEEFLIAVVLAGAGGACAFLGFCGFGIWPLALISLPLLWRALEEVRSDRLKWAALLGFVFGQVAYSGGFHWMWRIVDVFLDGNVVLGGLLWIADSSWFALRFALYASAYTLLRRRGWPVVVAALPPLLVVEWLHPLLFPVYLGHSLLPLITMIQIADVGGPLLLTGLLVMLNVAVFETWRWVRRERGAPNMVGIATLCAVALAWSYGSRRIARIDEVAAAAPALQVGIVQANIGVRDKGDDPARDHRAYLTQTHQLLQEGNVDLVVWPETVYTRGLRRPLPLSGRLIREELDVPLLFGAASVSGESGRNLKYNSALLVGGDGVIRDAYDKNLLIPFTEYVPLADRIAAIAERFAGASEFSAGNSQQPLRLGEWRIATPICHEIVQAAFVRRMVAAGAPHLIVTLANDSWFGDSQAPWLHLAMARLRGIEHRRYVVRATNSGVSAVIDANGRAVVRSGLLQRENLRATVRMLNETTAYTRWGDWPGWLAAFVLTLAAFSPRRHGDTEKM